MATAKAFAGVNAVIAPQPDIEAGVVPVPLLLLPNGKAISCWVLSPAELEEIARTGRIWLSVWSGLRHPKVEISGFAEPLLQN